MATRLEIRIGKNWKVIKKDDLNYVSYQYTEFTPRKKEEAPYWDWKRFLYHISLEDAVQMIANQSVPEEEYKELTDYLASYRRCCREMQESITAQIVTFERKKND